MEMMSAEISLLPFFVFFFLFYKKKGARKSGKLYAKCTLEMLTATERKKKKKPGKRKKRIFVVFLRLSFERKENFFLKENFKGLGYRLLALSQTVTTRTVACFTQVCNRARRETLTSTSAWFLFRLPLFFLLFFFFSCNFEEIENNPKEKK